MSEPVLSEAELRQLRVGDVIRNLGSGLVYVVTYTDGKTVVATRSLSVSNFTEWEVVER